MVGGGVVMAGLEGGGEGLGVGDGVHGVMVGLEVGGGRVMVGSGVHGVMGRMQGGGWIVVARLKGGGRQLVVGAGDMRGLE